MSRLGKKTIEIPNGVEVNLDGSALHVKGPKGALTRETFGRIQISREGNIITVLPVSGENSRPYWGLYRALLANMVEGVSQGFSRSLEVRGTGYRAAMAGKQLNLTLGFSHPVFVEPPAGVSFDVDKAGIITVHGTDKELVGLIADKVRRFRRPDAYKGKGVRYVGEVVKTKAGKSAGKK